MDEETENQKSSVVDLAIKRYISISHTESQVRKFKTKYLNDK